MTQAGTIFLVDDDAAVRHALGLLLEQSGHCVKGYASAEEFLEQYHPVPRSCAIVDMRMPGLNGLELQRELLQRGLRLPVIILTGHGDIRAAVDAVKLGAIEFLTKPVTGQSLAAALRNALAESDRLGAQADNQGALEGDLQELTAREREVLSLARQGQSNKEIARTLGISFRTVEIHRSRGMHKIGARNLLDLVRLSESAAGALHELLLLTRRSPFAIAVFDRDMRYLAFSPAWLEQYGKGRNDLTGLSCYEVHPNLPQPWITAHQRAMAGEFIKAEGDRWVDEDGRTRIVKWMVGPWRSDLGAIGGITIYAESVILPE